LLITSKKLETLVRVALEIAIIAISALNGNVDTKTLLP
jgi:hypothetical protein